MPFVTIRYVKENLGADAEERKTLAADQISDALVRAMGNGLGKDDVWIVWEPVPAAEWYLGGTSVAVRRRKKG